MCSLVVKVLRRLPIVRIPATRKRIPTSTKRPTMTARLFEDSCILYEIIIVETLHPFVIHFKHLAKGAHLQEFPVEEHGHSVSGGLCAGKVMGNNDGGGAVFFLHLVDEVVDLDARYG